MTSKIGDILLRAKIIDELQLRSAIAHQAQWGGRIGHIVVEKRFAKESAVVDAIAAALRLPKVELEQIHKDDAALSKLTSDYCLEKGVFPCILKDNGKTLWLAMVDPSDIPTVDELALKTRLRIMTVVAGESTVRTAIDRYYLHKEQQPVAQAYGAIAPAGPGELGPGEEMKIVDMSGRTVMKKIADILPAAELQAVAAAQGQAQAAPPPPLGGTSAMLDDLLGGMPSGPAWTPEELARLKALQDQQEKSTRIVRAVLDLCVEKGRFRLDEYKAKLGRG